MLRQSEYRQGHLQSWALGDLPGHCQFYLLPVQPLQSFVPWTGFALLASLLSAVPSGRVGFSHRAAGACSSRRTHFWCWSSKLRNEFGYGGAYCRRLMGRWKGGLNPWALPYTQGAALTRSVKRTQQMHRPLDSRRHTCHRVTVDPRTSMGTCVKDKRVKNSWWGDGNGVGLWGSRVYHYSKHTASFWQDYWSIFRVLKGNNSHKPETSQNLQRFKRCTVNKIEFMGKVRRNRKRLKMK